VDEHGNRAEIADLDGLGPRSVGRRHSRDSGDASVWSKLRGLFSPKKDEHEIYDAAARILIGDIGGTNCRLQMVDVHYMWGHLGMPYAPQKEEKIRTQYYKNEEYDSLQAIIEEFIKTTQGKRVPVVAALAVAGPVFEDRCPFTNGKWKQVTLVDGRELERELGIKRVRLLNDFVANGYGLTFVRPDETVVLQQGTGGRENGPIVVVGAGTGFGQVNLTHDGKDYHAFESEGGHTDFAPQSEEQDGLLRFLRAQFGHVSVERVLSGQGLKNVYDYLASVEPHKVSDEAKSRMAKEDPPKVVAEMGSKGSDELCQHALRMFVEIYGAEAGNKALSFLPYGGLFLAGGIAPKVLSTILTDDLFMRSFRNKGRLSPVLDAIPVTIVTEPELGLLGAKAIALRALRKLSEEGGMVKP